jgi:hypothetical protein
MIKGGDVKLELFGLCELSETNPKGAQVVIGNVLSLLENFVAVKR